MPRRSPNWLVDAYRTNMPFDQFARQILTAQGDTPKIRPPITFSVSDEGRADRDDRADLHGLTHRMRQVPQSSVRELDAWKTTTA